LLWTGIVCLLLAAWWFQEVTTRETVHTSDGQPFLSTWGIGKVILASVLGCVGLRLLGLACAPDSAMQTKLGAAQEEAFCEQHVLLLPISVHGLAGLEHEDLCQKTFNLDFIRVAKATASVGRGCLNSFLVCRTFMTLPDRDPDEHLNEARHYAGWIEMLVIGTFSGSFAFCFFFVSGIIVSGKEIKAAKGPLQYGLIIGSWAMRSREFLKTTSTFSVLKLIVFSSPMKVLMQMKKEYENWTKLLKDLPACMSGLVCALLAVGVGVLGSAFAFIGIMGLVIKVNSVVFVTHRTLTLNTPFTDTADFIALLGLASAIAGMVDVDTQKLQTVLEVAASAEEEDDIVISRKSFMVQQLVYGYCLRNFNLIKAWILIFTLDASDFQRLIFAKGKLE